MLDSNEQNCNTQSDGNYSLGEEPPECPSTHFMRRVIKFQHRGLLEQAFIDGLETNSPPWHFPSRLW